MLNFNSFENASILQPRFLLPFWYSISYKFVFNNVYIQFFLYLRLFVRSLTFSSYVFICCCCLRTRIDIARFMQRFVAVFIHSSSSTSLTLSSSSSVLSSGAPFTLSGSILLFRRRRLVASILFGVLFVFMCICSSVYWFLFPCCACFEPFWLCSVKFWNFLFSILSLCQNSVFYTNMCFYIYVFTQYTYDSLADVLIIHCICFLKSLL